MSTLAKEACAPIGLRALAIHRSVDGPTLGHIIMMAGVVVLLFITGHAQAAQPATARCESLTNDVVDRVLKGLDPENAQYVRRDIAGTKAPWAQDQAYARVRDAVAQIANARSLVRLEIAGGKGPGYNSLWFIDVGDKVLEFSTGSGRADYWRGTIPREEWETYKRYLKAMPEEGLQPIVSTSSVDAPIYYMCLLLNGREAALVVESIPDSVPQFSIIARTLALSRSKEVPRELQSLVQNGTAGQ